MDVAHLKAYRTIQHATDRAFQLLDQPVAPKKNSAWLESLLDVYFKENQGRSFHDTLEDFYDWLEAKNV